MKSLTKRIGVFTFVAFTAVMLVCTSLVLGYSASAQGETESGYEHFRGQLEDDQRAANFYRAFETLENTGKLKEGKIEFDLAANETASADDIAAYVENGDTKLVKAYGAGRDAFIMDHPDLFYADLFGTSISAGTQNKNYVAFLDTSRVLTLYKGNINSVDAVNSAIDAYEKKLAEIAAGAKAAGEVTEQIAYVNKYIAEHTEYSFGTTIRDGKNVTTPAADYIDTAYGSLVNGKAICGGFAKGFKAVMDRLSIPCVCVQGYAKSSASANFEPHMWNYVEVEGLWYAVDVTYNATGGKLDKYLLIGGQTLSENHMEDNVISTSGFELKYPAIKPYDYGVDTDDNGMNIEGQYSNSSDSTGKILTLTVSFDDKGAHKLQEEGKYLAFRLGNRDKENNLVWSPWVNCVNGSDYYMGVMMFKENSMLFRVYSNNEYVQFALIDYAPDESNGAMYPDRPEYGENAGKPCYHAYKPENLTDEHFIGALSTPYHNNGYGSYVAAPGMIGIYPSNTGGLPYDKTYNISVTYNDKLIFAEGYDAETIGMDYYTSRANDSIKKHAVVSDFQWDGDKKISFTFTPSKMYMHSVATYYFYPVGLVGEKSKKVPDPFTYYFKGKSVVCSKVFNDGRLYMNVFGAPKMLDDSDLSVTDFKDENGNYYAESQRSQLLLVANKPSPQREAEMDEVLEKEMSVKDEDVVSSATFEIDLQICGVVQKVPNGSYMQVAFGFPEGYSPDDAGTTFKIYHYKHDSSGKIIGVEEIPVIVTEYGLIAQVKSFSPFKIVQLKNTSAAVTDNGGKNIYACVVGNGGSISSDEAEGGIACVTGKSITYNIAANEGYTVANVKLNGKTLDASEYKKGKLTLSKDMLSASNMLEVSFVTEEAAKSYADRGISISAVTLPKKGGNGGLIATLVIVGIIVLAGAAAAVYFFVIRPKTQKQSANNTKKPAHAAVSAGGAKASAAQPRPSAPPHAKPAQNAARPAQQTSKPAARPATQARPSAQTRTQTGSPNTASRPQTRTAQSASRPTQSSPSAQRPAARPSTQARPSAGSQTQRPTTPPKKK